MNLRTNGMHSIFIEIMQQIENVPVYINRQMLCETWALNSGKNIYPILCSFSEFLQLSVDLVVNIYLMFLFLFWSLTNTRL